VQLKALGSHTHTQTRPDSLETKEPYKFFTYLLRIGRTAQI